MQVSTGDSACSQLVQGYLQYFAGERAVVYSAGVNPKGVNPVAIQVMAEDGIDISHHTNRLIQLPNIDWKPSSLRPISTKFINNMNVSLKT